MQKVIVRYALSLGDIACQRQRAHEQRLGPLLCYFGMHTEQRRLAKEVEAV